MCYEKRCGDKRHHCALGTGKNQTGATSCHPFDRNLLSRYKVYFGGHTDFGSECMLLGHYACSSLLQRPAELSTPVKENTSVLHPGPPVHLCSGSAPGTDQTSTMGNIPDPRALCGWKTEPWISLVEDPFGICRYERGERLKDTKCYHNCRRRRWEKFLRSASSVKMSNLCSSLFVLS